MYAIVIGAVVVIVFGLAGIRIAQEYERGVFFRLGRLKTMKGPGWFWLIPFADRVVKVDMRTITYQLETQETITRDGVPVRVNAVLIEQVDRIDRQDVRRDVVLEVERHEHEARAERPVDPGRCHHAAAAGRDPHRVAVREAQLRGILGREVEHRPNLSEIDGRERSATTASSSLAVRASQPGAKSSISTRRGRASSALARSPAAEPRGRRCHGQSS